MRGDRGVCLGDLGTRDVDAGGDAEPSSSASTLTLHPGGERTGDCLTDGETGGSKGRRARVAYLDLVDTGGVVGRRPGVEAMFTLHTHSSVFIVI